MRVISGMARGRRLRAPRGMRVRPTADRVKEALFSIILSRKGTLSGMRILDLFAGTGSLGIEALSRGAAGVVFVDDHRESAAAIRYNLEHSGFSGAGRVMVRDVMVAIRDLDRGGERFDLVFLDPPYRSGMAGRVLAALATSNLLTRSTLVVAEHAVKELLPEELGPVREIERRVYGDTVVSFLTLLAGDSPCPDP